MNGGNKSSRCCLAAHDGARGAPFNVLDGDVMDKTRKGTIPKTVIAKFELPMKAFNIENRPACASSKIVRGESSKHHEHFEPREPMQEGVCDVEIANNRPSLARPREPIIWRDVNAFVCHQCGERGHARR